LPLAGLRPHEGARPTSRHACSTAPARSQLEVSLQVEREGVASAQQAARRAEASLQRLSQRHGTIDLEEYNRLKAEADKTTEELAAARRELGAAQASAAAAVRAAEDAARARAQELTARAQREQAARQQAEEARRKAEEAAAKADAARQQAEAVKAEADARRQDVIKRANAQTSKYKVREGGRAAV
jgi:hypothetical protein